MNITMVCGGNAGGGTSFDNLADSSGAVGTASATLTVESGKKYLILLYTWGGSTFSPTLFDGATATGGTITKMKNLTATNRNCTGTIYQIDATSTSVTITASQAFAYVAFKIV